MDFSQHVFVILVVFCARICVCAHVCVMTSACLRSLLACILFCECPDPLRPPDLDPPHLSCPPPTARPSLASLQGAEERPLTTLPLPGHSLSHWTVSVRSSPGVDTVGDRGSIGGFSCSTYTPSEGVDVRRLLRAPRRQPHRGLGNCFPRVMARLGRRNVNT